MRFPKAPPDRNELLDKAIADKSQRIAAIFGNTGVVDHKGRYLHWDDIRYKVNPGGLTPEEVWLGTSMARDQVMQRLPLKDKVREPFRFCEPQIVRSTLRHLDMNAGGAMGADESNLGPAEAKRHLTRSLAEEPFASSFIEGAATTRRIAKKLIFEGREPVTRDELMVLNNYKAMQFVKANTNRELDLDMLLELHSIVADGTMDKESDAGRIRTSDDIQVVDAASGEVLHQPPPFAELPQRLQALFDFANEDSEGLNWIHPLLKAIILHFMLAYEHPFVDGNGRVSRALFYWYACKAGYWLMEYVSISSVIAEAKIEYGRSFLLVETDESDLTYFICNQLHTLKKAMDRLHAYVERRRAEVEELHERLFDRKGADSFNARQAFLVNEFARQRSNRITISEHEHKHNISYLTARSDLENLADRGYLRKTKLGTKSIYRPVQNIFELLTA